MISFLVILFFDSMDTLHYATGEAYGSVEDFEMIVKKNCELK